MGLFDNIFKKKTTVSQPTEPTTKSENKTDNGLYFDTLVSLAKSSGNPSDLEELYRAFLQLDEWVFIVSNNCTIENAKPFIGIVDEQPWLFVFTNSNKADRYARLFGNFLTTENSTLFLKMSRLGSLNMAKELNQRGVFGIRVNDGENGWFCPIPELFGIIEHFQIKID